MTKPIGLAEYKLTESLPENIKIALPTIEELEDELSKDFYNTSLERATVQYQTILDKLQTGLQLRDKHRKLLHKLAEKDVTLAARSVARHYDNHALAYQEEKISDANSTALEELENIVKICGGYDKLGLTPI